MRLRLLLLLSVAFLLIGIASPVHARTCTWTGEGDGLFWSDAENWEDKSGDPCVPGAGDTAIIGGTVQLEGSLSLTALELSGTLTIVDGDGVLTVNDLLLTNYGVIQGEGTLEVYDDADIVDGTISVAFTLPASGPTQCSVITLTGGDTLRVAGTLTGPSCTVRLNAGSVVENSGTIEPGVSLPVVGALDNDVEEVTPYPVVNNSGTMRTGTQAIFNNESGGTVEVPEGGFVNFTGGGTSSGTFLVPADPTPDNSITDNPTLRFSESFGITPHDLTGATIQGGGRVEFMDLRAPLTLTNATYDLGTSPESQTWVLGGTVTMPVSMTFGSLGRTLNVGEDDGKPGTLTVDHNVSVRELRVNSLPGIVAELGGTGTVTVDSLFDIDGVIREKTVTVGSGVGATDAPEVFGRISALDLAAGATVINEGIISFATRIRMAEGTAWTNNGTLQVKTGKDGEGIDTLGTPTTRPTVTNNSLLQFLDDGSTSGTLGVDLDNAGTFRLGYGRLNEHTGAPEVGRGEVTVTGGLTNRSGAEIIGTGSLGLAGAAQVTNDGRTAPGQPPADATGLLTIRGFTMSADATLDLDVVGGASADEDQLRARGTATVDGTLNVTLDDVPLGTYKLIGDNSSFTEEQISGTFAQVNVTPSGYTTSISYNENGTNDNVSLDVTGTPYPLLGETRAELDFGPAEVGDTETVEAENVGSGTLTLTGASVTGAQAANFAVAQPTAFPVELAMGETATVAVEVEGPERFNATTATLELAHTGAASGTATRSVALRADEVANPNFGGGGPNQGGYYFANSLFSPNPPPSQPSFDWVDISGSGTDRIGDFGSQGYIGPFPLGFTFRFFGEDYTQYWISENGWISFGADPGTDAGFNSTIPDTDDPNALVAWFWDSLDPNETAVSGRHLYTQQTTVEGRTAHVITFERYPESGADADGWITAQIVLMAGPDATTNGDVKLQYREHGASIYLESATVGIEGENGNEGVQYRYNDRGGALFGSPLAVQLGPQETALPVELARFSGATTENSVRLQWATASETNNSGFHVERRVASAPGGRRGWTDVHFEPGHGTTERKHSYTFVDETLPFAADSVFYRLRQVDTDGAEHVSEAIVVRLTEPDELTLHAPFPNPAHGTATIQYATPTAGEVELALYNVLGQRIATLHEETTPAGRTTTRLDTQRLPSGVYFVRLAADGQIRTRRLTVMH